MSLLPLNYTDFIVRDEDRKHLPWDLFNCWMKCFCIVTFDLELGQVIEKIFPEHVELSEKERMNICYLSFPDSNTGCMGDTQFHFRIRSNSSKASGKNLSERDLPVYLRVYTIFILSLINSYKCFFLSCFLFSSLCHHH